MIPLNSDTETKPTAAMRRAMAAAEVGDEQKGEDPTVNRLVERVAELLGKEAALFLPTGTMCNLVAVSVGARVGEILFADPLAHVLRAESGGAAFGARAMVEPIRCERGIFTAQQLDEAIAITTLAPPVKACVPKLLCVEQTHNLSGGRVWPLESLRAVTDHARSCDLDVHMDGARLMNAVVASGTSAAEFGACADTLWIDFSKGLGAPFGAVLAGSAAFIEEATPWKHRLGGAMRQAGIVAAACLYALDHHVERLADDHDNARRLSNGLAGVGGIRLGAPAPESNMVFFDTADLGTDNQTFLGRLRERGVTMSAVGSGIRAVTHLDIRRRDIDEAVSAVAAVAGGAGP